MLNVGDAEKRKLTQQTLWSYADEIVESFKHGSISYLDWCAKEAMRPTRANGTAEIVFRYRNGKLEISLWQRMEGTTNG